jgi:hypothetical protein
LATAQFDALKLNQMKKQTKNPSHIIAAIFQNKYARRNNDSKELRKNFKINMVKSFKHIYRREKKQRAKNINIVGKIIQKCQWKEQKFESAFQRSSLTLPSS